jgi:hypothetical protein
MEPLISSIPAGRARNSATINGANATQEKMYKPGRGKIRTCSSDERPINSQALE